MWFLADAYGVSLIWSGQLWLLILTILLWIKNRDKRWGQYEILSKTAASTLGLAAIVYYAIVYPPITTVAHVVAGLVGLLLALPMVRDRGEVATGVCFLKRKKRKLSDTN